MENHAGAAFGETPLARSRFDGQVIARIETSPAAVAAFLLAMYFATVVCPTSIPSLSSFAVDARCSPKAGSRRSFRE
jgi:hypothetical protein